VPHDTDLVARHLLDPSSPETLALHSLSKEIAATSNEYAEQLTFTDVTQFNGEAMRERVGRLIESSQYYAHDLGQYWSELSGLAQDRYTYQSGDARILKTLEASFADISDRLKTQLSEFNAVTSPYEDDAYDADKIAEVGAKLRDTLAEGIKKANQISEIPIGDEKDQQLAEILFHETIGATLVGLSQQIGARLDVLASGQPVDRITISNQTQDLLRRALIDPALKAITSQLGEEQELQSTLAKNDFSAHAVNVMNSRSIDIQLMFNKGKLTDAERAPLQAEKQKIDALLNAYHLTVSLVDKPLKVQKTIQTIQQKLTGISFSLKTAKSQETVVKLLADFRDLQNQLALAEAPFFENGVEIVNANTENLRERQDAYVENLAAAKQSIGENLAKYWREVKSDFLDKVKALSGSELKNTLDAAFGSGLAEKLESWDKEANKTKLNAEQLQAKATDVISTLDVYSNRVQLAFKTGKDPAKQEVLDDLQAKISALRKSVANRLGRLFEIGVFDAQ
jgi:hypothetical protein